MRVALCSALVPLLFAVSCTSCSEEEAAPAAVTAEPSPGVTRCMHGIERALTAKTSDEASRVYHAECADLFSDAACRDGWKAAAAAEPGARFELVANACRKGYCATLGSYAFAICKDDFPMTTEALKREWPPFFDAIVARESGMSATSLSTGLLAMYAYTGGLEAQERAAASPSGSAAPSASAAPSSSAAASAAPSASASAAPTAKAPGTPPKGAASAAPKTPLNSRQ